MDFSFLCNPAIAMKNYGLAVGIIATAGVAISAYFNKGAALMVAFSSIILAVILLQNLSTIAGWLKLPMICAGL